MKIKQFTPDNRGGYIKSGRGILFPLTAIVVLTLCFTQWECVLSQANTEKRKEYLRKLVPLLAIDKDERGADPRISLEYQNWKEWLEKTGELPPDFDSIPGNAALPDPLVIGVSFPL